MSLQRISLLLPDELIDEINAVRYKKNKGTADPLTVHEIGEYLLRQGLHADAIRAKRN